MKKHILFAFLTLTGTGCASLNEHRTPSSQPALLMNCTNNFGLGLTTTATDDPNVVVLQLTSDENSASASQKIAVRDLVQPADHPFNTKIKLSMKGFLAGVDLTFRFTDLAVMLTMKDNARLLKCSVTGTFLQQLDDTLHGKTANAM